MKKFISLIIFLNVLIGSACAETTAPQVMVPPTPEKSSPELHYFQGQTVTLPLWICSPSAPKSLQAQLYQITSSLQVPYGEKINLSLESKETTSSCLASSITLTMPDVKRETRFQLQFRFPEKGSESWTHAGQIQLIVYPRQILEPLKTWSKNVQLRVKDPDDKLSSFLKSQGIEFTDTRATFIPQPAKPVVTLVVVPAGQPSSLKKYEKPGETTFVFYDQLSSLPLIVEHRRENTSLIEIKMDLLKNLAADPQTQKLFLELIQLENPDPKK